MTEISPDPALSVRDLTVRDESRSRLIIDAASIDIARGEFVSLVGPSGSGKSTTALSIMGLLRHPLAVTSGTGVVAGHSINFVDRNAMAQLRGKLAAMIFQDPFSSLNPVLRCGVQAGEPLRIHRTLSAAERRGEVLRLFSEVGFEDPNRVYESLPTQLSGGQLQRVMISMAISLHPAILLADEPTTALDPASQLAIVDVLRSLQQRSRIAVLLITHDLDLARSASDRILQMRDGRVIPTDKTEDSDQARLGHAYQSGAYVRASEENVVMVARNVTKTFTRGGTFGGATTQIKGLDAVSMRLGRGEIVGVIGPSGSGKTTLGRCVAGIESPETGEILLEGKSVLQYRGRGSPSPIQVVYQSPYASLNPTMRVGEAIGEGLRSLGWSRMQRQQEVLNLLHEVGLPTAYWNRLPAELSGGERQRVVIARALAARPQMLVADEPTASLDERTAIQILDLLRRLSKDRGLATLLISHDQKIIAQVADRVVRLQGGKLVEDDGNVKSPPRNASYSSSAETLTSS